MILFNGDSHTFAEGVKNRFIDILSDEFKIKSVNLAKGGASNTRIIRTTKNYIAEYIPKLVVIGWSTWEREEWEYNSNYYDVNSSGHDVLPDVLTEKYKTWVIAQTPESLTFKSQQCHEEIYQFHLELKQKNINHLFFNCMYNFFQPQNIYEWDDQYLEPYNNDASYYWYLKNQGLKTDDWYHYESDGHAVWAQILIDHIKKHKLL